MVVQSWTSFTFIAAFFVFTMVYWYWRGFVAETAAVVVVVAIVLDVVIIRAWHKMGAWSCRAGHHHIHGSERSYLRWFVLGDACSGADTMESLTKSPIGLIQKNGKHLKREKSQSASKQHQQEQQEQKQHQQQQQQQPAAGA